MHFSIPDTQVFNNDNGASSYTVSLFDENIPILLFIFYKLNVGANAHSLEIQ